MKFCSYGRHNCATLCRMGDLPWSVTGYLLGSRNIETIGYRYSITSPTIPTSNAYENRFFFRLFSLCRSYIAHSYTRQSRSLTISKQDILLVQMFYAHVSPLSNNNLPSKNKRHGNFLLESLLRKFICHIDTYTQVMSQMTQRPIISIWPERV